MPKKIIIIGDSWGVGAYRYVGNPPTAIESVKNTGIDFFLKNEGFEVINYAVSAANNLEQLELLKEQTEPADAIIWFYTEVTRDLLYKQVEGVTYKELSEHASKRNFELAEQIYEANHIPFFIIGCLTPIPKSIKHYSFAKLIIPSWLDELTEYKYDLPISLHSNNFTKVIDHYKPTDYSFMNNEMNKMIYLETKLENHQAFSQGVHPNKDSFYKLTERIRCLL